MNKLYHLLVIGLGVHFTFRKSLSFTDPSRSRSNNPPPALPLNGVKVPLPPVLLANRALAAGVKSPTFLLGVAAPGGGAILPFVLGVLAPPFNKAAFSRIDRLAFIDNLRPVSSLRDGGFIRNGVASGLVGISSSPVRVDERSRGVARREPIVINSFNAVGPS